MEDFGGKVLDRPIELVSADHLNKPDIGIGLARKWYDEDVHAIFDIGITSVAIGVQNLAKEKNKVAVFISSSSSDLTGKYCGPNGIHWHHNNFSQAFGVVKAAIDAGGKDFFFMTVDYAFGHNIQRDTTAMIEANGGKVLGATPHPFDRTDYSSDLLKAQSSRAKVIALATTSVHVPSIVKQADEFGIRPAQIVAPLSMTLHDVKSIGLQSAQGLMETTSYYWDQNDETRTFAKRFQERFKKMPNMNHAAAYGAVMHYLKAVQASGTGDGNIVMAKMKETPINDFMTKNGRIRPDGQVMRDQYLLQVKTPVESKSEWDLYKVLATVPAEVAFQKADPAACSYAK
ncbi:ABC transporter substrate-binding protein [Bosea sp. CRIB-10]|uniref:ABC transporter substrate-binding protein n=1 Tax=Bosea sp. CRIB-10 TaxID=378404 RepID=UPI001FCCE8C0|nr:ABC transporter substrate-binding protein [Bosea sp. CRIB-10]